MHKKIKEILYYDLEKIPIKYMTSVIFIIVGIVWILYGTNKTDINFSLTSTGAIIAFWYGYKKYERDKELEIINNLIIKENIDELIIDWKTKRKLYEKGYLADYLWSIIETNYQIKFSNYIGILKEIDYSKEFIIIDMTLVIQNLLSYKGSEKYFLEQINVIDKVIEWDIKFYEKLNNNLPKINYLKELSTEIKKTLKNNNL